MYYGIWNVKEGDKFTCMDSEGDPITRRVLRLYPPNPIIKGDWLRNANYTMLFFGSEETMYWSPQDTVIAFNEETSAWETTTKTNWWG